MPDKEQDAALQEAILLNHEPRDLSVRKVLIVATWLLVSVPVIVVILWFHFQIMASPRYSGLTAPSIVTGNAHPARNYPAPRLIRIPGAQLAALRAQEDTILTNYGWIDRTQQIVRLPIERAMALVAQRGLPVGPAVSTNIDSSEYELVIKRRLEREKSIREGKAPEE